MPFSVPTPPPTSLAATLAGLPPDISKRSLSSHFAPSNSFSNQNGSGAFMPLGMLPRRDPKHIPSLSGNPKVTSANAKRFHLRANSASSSSSSEDESDFLHPPNQPHRQEDIANDDTDNGNGWPPMLKLRVHHLHQSNHDGVPFPRSSPNSSPLPRSPMPLSMQASGEQLSPLEEIHSDIIGLPSSQSTAPLPISASNPIYSPYQYSPQDRKALTLPLRPSPTRSSSSPHLPSNRPLKSSLKSSSSTSSIHSHSGPGHHVHHAQYAHSAHLRASSAPSTPGQQITYYDSGPSSPGSPTSTSSPLNSGTSSPTTPKSVHFPSLPIHLERVRLFHKTAKPASLLTVRTAEETETETETDRVNDWGYGFRGASATSRTGAFPFPKMSPSPGSPNSSVWPLVSPEYRNGSMKLELDMGGYPIPDPSSIPPTSGTNIFLESISLSPFAPDDKLHVTGSFIVRNLAFEKDVAVRFTMDEWSTVSEIKANWVTNVPSPFVGHRSSLKSTDSWDRFSFLINLSDYTPISLPSKTIYFVGRYTVPGGEYWDNCRGRNWRIRFKVAALEDDKKLVPSVPPNVIISPPSASSPATSMADTTVPLASFARSTLTDLASPIPTIKSPSSGRSEALAQATAQRLRKFSLSNYVAPGSSLSLIPAAKVELNSTQQSSSSELAPTEPIAADKEEAQSFPTNVPTPSSVSAISPISRASISSPGTSTPPVEANSETLYDWFVKRWCFAEPDQPWIPNRDGSGVPNSGLGLEISQ
ncbi:hypothetical protein D9757_006927 [Collybiopsis confluens]|uniref:CBM21 domain-containing protein n=1 Tax=Collybiopsis confluens TaxID=2823264 RepID=A0A8H5M7E5_9AGAR|nr:hypothetical protein D9757_006927 [Collybiopsis confluens]